MKDVLWMLRGVIVSVVTLVVDVVLPILNQLILLLDFPGEVIWVVYSRLKDWSDWNKKCG